MLGGGGVRGDPILEYIFKIFNFALCLKDPRVEGVWMMKSRTRKILVSNYKCRGGVLQTED